MPTLFKHGYASLLMLLLIFTVGTLSVIYGMSYFTVQSKLDEAGKVLASMGENTKLGPNVKPTTCGNDGLYAHFSFEDVTGASVPDLSGCGNNGTLEDSVNIGGDPFVLSEGCKVGNSCVSFDGKDDFMSLPAPLALTAGNNNDPVKDFSWSFWIFPRASRQPGTGCNADGGSQFCAAFIHRGSWLPDRHVGYLLSSYPPGDLLRTRWQNNNILDSVTTLIPNRWHHVVLTRYEDYYPPWQEYAHMRFYIDGVKVDEDVFVQDNGYWDEYVNENQKYLGTFIGGDGAPGGANGYGWAGHVFAFMDDVKVYNRELTKVEVCKEFICAPGGVSSGSCEDPGNPPIQVSCP